MSDVTMTIYYTGPIDKELDELIKDLGERMGFEFYGSGMELWTWTRDLSFHADNEALKKSVKED